jgi:hypothetical protein
LLYATPTFRLSASFLEDRGYRHVPSGGSWARNFVLGDDQGHRIDLHSFELDTGNDPVTIVHSLWRLLSDAKPSPLLEEFQQAPRRRWQPPVAWNSDSGSLPVLMRLPTLALEDFVPR